MGNRGVVGLNPTLSPMECNMLRPEGMFMQICVCEIIRDVIRFMYLESAASSILLSSLLLSASFGWLQGWEDASIFKTRVHLYSGRMGRKIHGRSFDTSHHPQLIPTPDPFFSLCLFQVCALTAAGSWLRVRQVLDINQYYLMIRSSS